LIAFLEERPAYKRNVKDIQQIRKGSNDLASATQKIVSNSVVNHGQKPKGGTVISF